MRRFRLCRWVRRRRITTL